MGEYFHADYCGVMVTRYKAAGRVDYKKLLADKASGVKPEDVDQYREKSSERCRVSWVLQKGWKQLCQLIESLKSRFGQRSMPP